MGAPGGGNWKNLPGRSALPGSLRRIIRTLLSRAVRESRPYPRYNTLAQLLPGTVCPKIKLFTLQRWPLGQHETRSNTEPINSVPSMYDPFTHLLPAPVCPKTKLSTQKGWPKGSRAGAVHGPWLEVLRNHMRHVASSSCFAEVDIDAFKLKLPGR